MKKVKAMALLFGVSTKTLYNWENPTPTTRKGRYHLARAAKLYFRLLEMEKEGISSASTLESIANAIVFLKKEGGIEINGEEISFKEIGEEMLCKRGEEIKKIQEAFKTAAVGKEKELDPKGGLSLP